MAPSEQLNKISLTLLIDEKKNKVLYAEAENDFVDVLLSFLTLPLGTISRLVSKDSTVQPCRFGCVSALHQSVENLEPKCFASDGNKGKLLNPINPMEADSKNLVFNFDDTQISKCFLGYLYKQACFIVSDDLTVMPSDTKTIMWILRNFRLELVPQRLTVNVTQKEVLDLLKFSLWSKTPLTDLFLHKELHIHNPETQPESMVSAVQRWEGRKMTLMVMISKSERKILFAQAEEDFTDQLLSFLTIPLGVVEHLVQGNSGLGCIDNLYKSLADLNSSRYFNSNFGDLKYKLLNPLIPASNIRNQMLPIYSDGPGEIGYYGYASWRTMFMVADDLSIKPFSIPAALSFLRESKVVEQDLEVRNVCIGVNGVFGILKAAMVSSSALTTVLGPFLNFVEEEK